MTQINLTGFPGAVDALRRTRSFFLGPVNPPSSVAALRGAGASDETAEERAAGRRDCDPQQMIALAREHLRMQRDIHLDFLRTFERLSRDELRELTGESEVSDNRKSSGGNNADLLRKAEPDWLNPAPRQLATLPRPLREAVEVLHELDAELVRLSAQDELRDAALQMCRQEMELTRVATKVLAVETDRDRLIDAIDAVYAGAARSSRTLNLADRRRLDRLRERLSGLNANADLARIRPSHLEALTEELNRLVRRHNRRELESGLLRTPQMREVLSKALPPLVQGRPVLLVGETGGAKTALAAALARQASRTEPELVSFHGEINTYQLIGRDRIEADGGMSFRQGPVLRAMVTGAPLILDEVNAAPAEFLKRLNVIMQLRQGDTFLVQEDSDSRVVVRHGFCIIATANEKSARYKGVDVLSAELKNRFGTNVYRIGYPDSDVVLGELPRDGLALAEAALSDELGAFAVDLPEGQLLALVKAAHATQKLFTGDYGDAGKDELVRSYVPVDRLADGVRAPALDDTVLSPRMVVAMLEQVRDGLGRVKLTEILRDWVAGVEKPRDREVLLHLLDSFVSQDGVTLLGNPAWAVEPAAV